MAIKYKAPKQQEEDEIRQAARATPEDARQAAQGPEVDIYGATKDDSVFGEAADQMKVGTPGEIQQAAQDVAADTRDASQDYLEDVYEGDEGDGGAPAPAEEESQGLFEDVTDIDARQERERAAFADELAARKAEQQQQAEARAGLGGMGLSGATAELTADIGRQAERAGDIAMADLGRRQQQETFDELRRQASIWTFEEEFGVDLDGDGKFGSGGAEEAESPEPAITESKNIVRSATDPVRDAIGEFTGRGDVELTAAPGHPDNPMQVEPQELPSGVKQVGTDDEGNIIYEGPDGTYYKTKSSAEGFREWEA